MSLRNAALAAAAVSCAAGLAVPALTARPATADSGVTVYGCVTSSHRLVQVAVNTPLPCPSGAVLVSWPGQAGAPSPSPSPTPTSTSPSPAPTVTSPVPTDTGPSPSPSLTGTSTSSASPSPSAWACVTSSFTGGCDFADPGVYGSNTTGASSVRNQIWGPVPGETSTMRANGLADWQDTISVPAGNTSVTGWPDSQVTLTTGSNTPDPLTGYHSLASTLTLASQAVPGAAYDNGWDVWGGHSGQVGSDYAFEMMIWTDQLGRGTCGGATVLTSAVFAGQAFTLCRNGPAGSTSEYIWYQSDAAGNPVNTTSSAVDIYAMLQWMIGQGYYPSDYGLNQVTVGSEVCSTGGQDQAVTLSGWTLTAS